MTSPIDELEIQTTASVGVPEGDSVRSWREVRDLIADRAKYLPNLPPRAVVGIQGENGLETVLQIFAALEAGYVPAPFAPAVANTVAAACLARLGAAAAWDSTAGWRPMEGESAVPGGFDLVMHTSGSTGLPKPIAIRLAAMRDNARDVARALDLRHTDVHLGSMSHCYMSGLYNATVLPLVLGARSVLGGVLAPATLASFVDAIRKFEPTIIWLNPLAAEMLTRLRSVAGETFQGVRYAISCTAPLAAAAKTAFETKFGVPLLQSYGLSETLITTMEDPAAPAPGTSGKPVGLGVPVRVAPDGRVTIQNSGMCAGYLDPMPRGRVQPLRTFETEDQGHFDAFGNLIITGRISDTIHRHGVKFSPDRIEGALLEQPGVAECAVVDFAKNGRTVLVAWIRGSGAPAALFEALRQRLAPHECPDVIEFIDDLPRTHTGKVDRRALREQEPHALHRP